MSGESGELMNSFVAIAIVLATLSFVIWLFLVFCWGNFWRCDQRLDEGSLPKPIDKYPPVAIVIPARNEASVIGESLRSLLAQTYPGPLRIILVDDQSSDGTGAIATDLAQQLHKQGPSEAPHRQLTVLPGQPLPSGWTGKLWALKQGIDWAQQLPHASVSEQPDYILLTDADIRHAPHNLEQLIVKAEWEALDLTSLMVQLRCDSFWERQLIPAFIFFFQKLYPFPWVNQPQRKIAAAAGGCILLRTSMLQAIGGIEVVREALIDDCSLAAAVKRRGGHIWLGLSTQTVSLRPYPTLKSIWDMVARTAYTQLYYSPWLLMGTLVGMSLVYLVAPLAVLWGALSMNGPLLSLGLLTWGLMAIAYWPTLRLYRQPWFASLGLPAIALLYSLMTLDSARRHWQGKGGTWKGRSYSHP